MSSHCDLDQDDDHCRYPHVCLVMIQREAGGRAPIFSDLHIQAFLFYPAMNHVMTGVLCIYDKKVSNVVQVIGVIIMLYRL